IDICVPAHCLFVFSEQYAAYRDLHSFPTRRSSDLVSESFDRDHGLFSDDEDYSPDNTLGVEPLPSVAELEEHVLEQEEQGAMEVDRKSTRLNSSHVKISYAVFCLKKKKKKK